MKTIFSLALVVILTVSSSPVSAGDPEFFDGKSMKGWTRADGKPVSKGWEVVDGTIHLKKGERGGNIFSKKEYGDFRLSFEWAIAPGGNSGLKYRVRDFGGRQLGCEYQVFDDAARKLGPKHTSASLYAVYEPNPPATTLLKPAGEFNSAVIIVSGNRIEHWLNGKRVVLAIVGSPEWNERIAASKFGKIEGFGRNRKGRIMLTDHGSEVWYRDLTIEELPPAGGIANRRQGPLRAAFANRRGPLLRGGALRRRVQRLLRRVRGR